MIISSNELEMRSKKRLFSQSREMRKSRGRTRKDKNNHSKAISERALWNLKVVNGH